MQATRSQLNRTHKLLLRRNSKEEIAALEECQYLYLGVEAEARLRKILHDPTGFSHSERTEILKEKTQIGRWIAAVNAAFCKHYLGTFSTRIDRALLHGTAEQRHGALIGMLESELRPVIENRNKIAHAQTQWQLKSRSDSDFKASSQPLSYGDYWDLNQMQTALEQIGEIVLILIVSQPTFERDFDGRFGAFAAARSRLAANADGSELARFVRGLAPIGGWRTGGPSPRGAAIAGHQQARGKA